MFFTRPKLEDQRVRLAVLQNLAHLQYLYTARGSELKFDQKAETKTLEDLLWKNVDELTRRCGLSFMPSEPCESRIRTIKAHLPAMPRPTPRQDSGQPDRRYDLFHHLGIRI